MLGVPAPMLVFIGAVLVWHVLMSRSRLGFATRMVGSNLEAARYSGVPAPMLVFIGAVLVWHVLMSRSRLGFATRMVGSNLEAARYSGVPTRRSLTLIHTLSGLMCGLAGIVMLARFNSVRVGHGEAYVLITVLGCFLGGVDPNGGFGRVPPVAIALIILQAIASGLNLLGANQHLATALWGGFLLMVMVVRSIWRSGFLQIMFARR